MKFFSSPWNSTRYMDRDPEALIQAQVGQFLVHTYREQKFSGDTIVAAISFGNFQNDPEVLELKKKRAEDLDAHLRSMERTKRNI